MKYQEKMLDIYVRIPALGKPLHSEYYGLDLNDYENETQEYAPER